MTEYLMVLAGKPPEGAAALAFYARVAEITGLPVETVTRVRGFAGQAYEKRVRDGRSEVVSPYDASVPRARSIPGVRNSAEVRRSCPRRLHPARSAARSSAMRATSSASRPR